MSHKSKVFSIKKRRGLSTVVTSAILLSAVSIMGVMLIGWANTNLAQQQIALSDSLDDKMNKLNEDLLVEKIWFGTGPDIVNVTISNVGSIGFNITNINIENSTSTLFDTITDGGIAPGDEYAYEIPFSWTSGETTDFTIFTERGNIFVSQEVT